MEWLAARAGRAVSASLNSGLVQGSMLTIAPNDIVSDVVEAVGTAILKVPLLPDVRAEELAEDGLEDGCQNAGFIPRRSSRRLPETVKADLVAAGQGVVVPDLPAPPSPRIAARWERSREAKETVLPT